MKVFCKQHFEGVLVSLTHW